MSPEGKRVVGKMVKLLRRFSALTSDLNDGDWNELCDHCSTAPVTWRDIRALESILHDASAAQEAGK